VSSATPIPSPNPTRMGGEIQPLSIENRNRNATPKSKSPMPTLFSHHSPLRRLPRFPRSRGVPKLHPEPEQPEPVTVSSPTPPPSFLVAAGKPGGTSLALPARERSVPRSLWRSCSVVLSRRSTRSSNDGFLLSFTVSTFLLRVTLDDLFDPAQLLEDLFRNRREAA
jgi:hypothetical protein